MINGIGLPLEFWRPLEARLGRFRTITVDPPGSGHSSVPRGRFGVREHAGVIDDLLEHLGIDSAGVLGLSFGGMVAQELARRVPDASRGSRLPRRTAAWAACPARRGR
ncbi:alpha/beta fold hydrolase [Rhodococcus aetherivorans]|nr:alpha/beta fold hydrolase [Rhodococcus aetherivorans]